MSELRLGDIKQYLNKITHADCLEVLKELPDKSVDLVLTDFPYNEVNRDSNGLRPLDFGVADKLELSFEDLMTELIRVCKGSFYAFCGTEQVSDIRKYLVKSGLSMRLLIWEKTNPLPMNGEDIWLSGIECCVYGKLKGATFNEHCKNTVLRYPICADKFRFHKTQKPLAMFKYLVEVSSNKGDIVLDPFSGSGTTAIACHNLGRNFICIEKDEEYYKQSVERLDNVRCQLKLF